MRVGEREAKEPILLSIDVHLYDNAKGVSYSASHGIFLPSFVCWQTGYKIGHIVPCPLDFILPGILSYQTFRRIACERERESPSALYAVAWVENDLCPLPSFLPSGEKEWRRVISRASKGRWAGAVDSLLWYFRSELWGMRERAAKSRSLDGLLVWYGRSISLPPLLFPGGQIHIVLASLG